MEKMKQESKKWLFYFLLGISLIAVFKLLDNFTEIMGEAGKFFTILRPFLVGLFIAYLLYMPCRKIENLISQAKIQWFQKIARPLSILLVYVLVILLFIVLIRVILPVVFEGAQDLMNNLQSYIQGTIDNFNGLPEESFLKSDIVKEGLSTLQKIDVKQYLEWDRILGYLKNAIDAITGVFNVFIALIVSVYMLLERSHMVHFFKRLTNAIFKEKTYQNVSKYFDQSNEVFFKFIASQFLDAIIVGILVTIAMSLMGIKYAPVLGFLIGLFNMIPYVGAIIAVGLAAIITLITGGLSQAIWMLIIVIILQQIDANIINPKIVGHSLEMSPLLVIFAVTISGSYFGILGMFLAVPIMAIIKIMVGDFISYRLEKKEEEKILQEEQEEL